MISIIIPVYNVEQYLPQCIDSVLTQTLSDFELILVDDGSTDTSSDICDDYAKKDNRIHVIHIPNSGVSVARNTGIEESNGEWISFIDSDDFVGPDYLEQFQIGKDDADLIVQGLEYFDNRNGNYFKQVRVSDCTLEESGFKEKVAQNDLLRSGYPVAKAYRRNLLSDKIRFNTNISFHEDHIFVLEVMNVAKTIRLVDSIAYKYRYYHSTNSLSMKRHSWEKLNEAAEGMLCCLNAMKDRFLEEGGGYAKEIYTFAFTPKLDAIYEMFRTEGDYNNRRQNFSIIVCTGEVARYFHARSTKNKFIKFILETMPYPLTDIILKLVVKYQSRHLNH